MDAIAVILAAGLGTRMKSALPKAAHTLAGRPMLLHLMEAAGQVFPRLAVVVGPDMPALERLAAPHPTVVQRERRGTGDAARAAIPLFGEGDVAILFADNPLVRPETLQRLAAARAAADLALLAMRPADPARYGRIVTDAGRVVRIVEWKDATEAERAIRLCNAGAMIAPAASLARWLAAITADNAAGEYYLTDVVAAAVAEGATVRAVEAPEAECRGINSRAELAEAEADLQRRYRSAAMESGVGLMAPDTVHFSWDTELAPDTTVGPYVVFGPGVRAEGPVEIRAFSHLEGCTLAAGAVIGPFARLRPGTRVGKGAHVGNFVELKAADLGPGAKANHLAYLGDASIGAGANIGAGTITCNYDGAKKHRTTIGERVFVGSNATLVAPVSLAEGAYIAAGSTITDNVAADALAFGRARQAVKPGGGAAVRARIAR